MNTDTNSTVCVITSNSLMIQSKGRVMEMCVVRRLIGVLMLSLTASLASAHPSEEWAEQFRVLALWAESVSHFDAEGVAAVTADGATPFEGTPATILTTRHATFTETEAGVVASPVISNFDQGTMSFSWSVLLVAENGTWKVKSATPTGPAAPDLESRLPEHANTQAVSFSLTDKNSGSPVYARVRITDREGDYWPPNGHQKNIRIGWRQDVGGDVQVAEKTFAYVKPQFVARLPEGKYTIEVSKGTEYFPARRDFTVAKGTNTAPFEVAMNRWVNMKALGWHAGDTHTHFLAGPTGLLELRAEDLSVLYILATKWGELVTDVTRFTGQPIAGTQPGEIVVFNEETRHGWLGHTILHGIGELVYPLTWGGPSEGVPGGFDFPAMAMQADKTHAQDGLVTWAHFPFPGGELAVDVALNKIDTVDLFTWGDPFASTTGSGGEQQPSAIDTWYLFLNTNSRIPATAGTDKMLNIQVTGAVRTYARTGSVVTYENWLNTLRRGETFVSTGPIVTLTANGQPIGSDLNLKQGAKVVLKAELQAPFELYPVDQLEIVLGGEVIASVTNEGKRSKLSLATTIEVNASTWVAARANGSTLLPHQQWALSNNAGIPPMAHTSPIYLMVGEAPIWVPAAAAVLEQRVDIAINWAKTQAHYQTETDRRQVLDVFEQAKAYYANAPQ